MPTALREPAQALLDAPLFSARQAHEWGISAKDLAVLVRRELLLRVDRGWYSTMVSADAETLHVLRTVAALELHEHSLATDHSAALLHGLPLARTDLSHVHLVRTRGHGSARAGVRSWGRFGEPAVKVHVDLVDRLVPAVDVATAVVGIAMTNNPVAALVAGDFALASGACTRGEIDEVIVRCHGRRGVEAARQVVPHLDPAHESPGETLTRWELRRLGWDLVPQWEVKVGRRTYRMDFKVRGLKLGVEFDGEVKHTIPGARVAQELRQEEIEDQGWVFVRYDWDDLDSPAEMHRRLREGAARAQSDD